MEITVCVKQVSPTASECHARTHSVVCDRPEAKGGTDKGPMGGEALLMGLGGCFMSNLLAAIAARELDIKNINLDVVATIAEAPPRFSDIVVKVRGDYPDRAEMEKLVTISERACIVSNSLKNGLNLSFELV